MSTYYNIELRNQALKILQERTKYEEEEDEEEDEIEDEESSEEGEEKEDTDDDEEVEESCDGDDDKQFAEWFNEEMKKNEFNEGLFDGVKAFLGAAQDVKAGLSAGKKAYQSGKGAGDVLSIAGTQMKSSKFQRAYKEMWLGFNKGLKLMNPKLQSQIATNEKVREAVNQMLGNIVEGLERGVILKVAEATQDALPGTNPEQDEARAQNSGGETPVEA